MRRIFALGETVYDIIFHNKQPVAASAGGSMLNTAVSLGRIRLPVHFVSEFGNDNAGNLIHDFLSENNVSDKYTYRHHDGKTSLSLAILDDNGDASYSFYKMLPEKRLDKIMPRPKPDDIFVFGSFFAITADIRSRVIEIINYASKHGALIIYDPNFRKLHLDQLEKLKGYIIENISFAHLVRGSDEDFKNIFSVDNSLDAYEKISSYGCPNLIYTENKNGIKLHTQNFHLSFDVPAIEPVSTIGAGDSFNAGIVSSLYEQNISRNELEKLSKEKWTKIIRRGVEFGSNVCLSYENYVSLEFANRYVK